MVAEDSEGPREPGGPRWFATTHWSVVVAAAAEQQSPESLTALGQLCRTYWYPLYAYARRQGHPAADAEDLTQGLGAGNVGPFREEAQYTVGSGATPVPSCPQDADIIWRHDLVKSMNTLFAVEAGHPK